MRRQTVSEWRREMRATLWLCAVLMPPCLVYLAYAFITQ